MKKHILRISVELALALALTLAWRYIASPPAADSAGQAPCPCACEKCSCKAPNQLFAIRPYGNGTVHIHQREKQLAQYLWTDEGLGKDVVDLLNNFRYQETEPDTGKGEYRYSLQLNLLDCSRRFAFTSDAILVQGVWYQGEPGYFHPLVQLAENAPAAPPEN